MLGIIGIVVAVAIFIFMAFKGVNLVVTAMVATVIMILANGMPLYDTLVGTYVASEGAAATGYMT